MVEDVFTAARAGPRAACWPGFWQYARHCGLRAPAGRHSVLSWTPSSRSELPSHAGFSATRRRAALPSRAEPSTTVLAARRSNLARRRTRTPRDS